MSHPERNVAASALRSALQTVGGLVRCPRPVEDIEPADGALEENETQPAVDLDRLRADLIALGAMGAPWAAHTEPWLPEMRARGFDDADVMAVVAVMLKTLLDRVIADRDAARQRLIAAGQGEWVS